MRAQPCSHPGRLKQHILKLRSGIPCNIRHDNLPSLIEQLDYNFSSKVCQGYILSRSPDFVGPLRFVWTGLDCARVTSLAGNDLPTDPAGAHEPSLHDHPSVAGILEVK